ncbi:serine/threonine-protein kinase STY13-like [Magnolia sinica]|uniref:serine/threonine-protein kinase STY13-like n=1 Tax=Magnolia sinica TaxID=86752 RepID=UPI002657B842|nr:serine/threonine-protein kinase STY13-like [Magnolia sinica]
MNLPSNDSPSKQENKLFREYRCGSPVTKSPATLRKPPALQRKCYTLGCLGISSSTLESTHLRPSKIKRQVADLQRQLNQEREQKEMIKAKLEMMHDYLKYCLQIAQEKGFMDLIVNFARQSPLSTDFISTLQPTMTVDQHLSSITNQAKMNGWFIEPHEIELHEKVGQGSTADIYRATWRGLDVAVKCIYPDHFHSSENSYMWFAQELETLSRQRHPFVLHLIGACLGPPENGWVVTEFLSGRTLKEWLHGPGKRKKERSIPLPPLEDRIDKGLEIAKAMQYLHGQMPKVLHRDLKPSNIFLDDAMHVRVADFGHARFLREGEKAHTGETGTFVYMAPEVIRVEPYDEKCDVYSFGIILNELITGQYPYVDTDYGPFEIAREVGNGRLRPTLPTDDDGRLEELICLIRHSWDANPSIRPSFAIVTCALRKIKEQLNEPKL